MIAKKDKIAKVDEKEIQEVIDKATDMINSNMNPYFGMSYIEGVRAALEWVQDRQMGKPLEND